MLEIVLHLKQRFSENKSSTIEEFLLNNIIFLFAHPNY
jgi:hypothetical protein